MKIIIVALLCLIWVVQVSARGGGTHHRCTGDDCPKTSKTAAIIALSVSGGIILLCCLLPCVALCIALCVAFCIFRCSKNGHGSNYDV